MAEFDKFKEPTHAQPVETKVGEWRAHMNKEMNITGHLFQIVSLAMLVGGAISATLALQPLIVVGVAYAFGAAMRGTARSIGEDVLAEKEGRESKSSVIKSSLRALVPIV